MSAEPNWRGVLTVARDDAALRAVANYSTLERMTSQLPAAYIVKLMRKLNEELSFSYGYDKISYGLDLVDGDLRDEDAGA